MVYGNLPKHPSDWFTVDRLEDQVLKGLHLKTLLVYLLIVVLGKRFDEHLKKLNQVFQLIGTLRTQKENEGHLPM